MFIGYEYVRVFDRVLWETDGSIDRPTDRRMSFKIRPFFSGMIEDCRITNMVGKTYIWTTQYEAISRTTEKLITDNGR